MSEVFQKFQNQKTRSQQLMRRIEKWDEVFDLKYFSLWYFGIRYFGIGYFGIGYFCASYFVMTIYSPDARKASKIANWEC